MQKLKFILVLLLFSLNYNSTLAQTPILNAVNNYKPGIYKSFEEFVNNAPSLPFDYSISEKKRGYGALNMGGSVVYHRIGISKKKGKEIGTVYGFSDGQFIYLSPFEPELGPKTEFSKIKYLAPVSYYEDRDCNIVNGSRACSLSRRLISLTNGEIGRLTKKGLREILSIEPDLLEKFNNDPDRNKKLFAYYVSFMERQKSKSQ